jgi:hypothetical protein
MGGGGVSGVVGGGELVRNMGAGILEAAVGDEDVKW